MSQGNHENAAWETLFAQHTQALGEIYGDIARLPRFSPAMAQRYGEQVYEVYDEYATRLSRWRREAVAALGAHYDAYFAAQSQAEGDVETREEFIRHELDTTKTMVLKKLFPTPHGDRALFDENLQLVESRPVAKRPTALDKILGVDLNPTAGRGPGR